MELRLLLSQAIELHQLDCKSQRFTERTLQTYQQRLGVFLRFVGDMPLAKLQAMHIRAFQNDMVERNVGSAYQHALMRGVRAFLNYCVRDELIEKSPMKTIKMPRQEKKLPDSVSDADLDKVLRLCCLRDKAMVLLIVSSGVRCAELCKLNVEDVELSTGTITVKQGKGQKDRITFADATACKTLKRYLMTRKGVKPSQPLLTSLNRLDKRLCTNAVNHAFQRLQDASGVHVTAHGLRRTFATRAMRQNLNIYILAKLMGHADITVLRAYLDIQPEDAKEAYQKVFG